jgi:hypothetical protein
MTSKDLRRLLEKSLGDVFLRCKGQILYSGIDTLTPGDFYFIGFNPAADGTNPRLCDVPLDRQHWSAYTDQCWTHEGCDTKVCPNTGNARHQKRVQNIMAELGIHPKTTFATNFIFVESRNVKQIKKAITDYDLIEACWRVHKQMLSVVRPKYIVCLGNGKSDSAFNLVRQRVTSLAVDGKLSDKKVGRSVAFKSFTGTFNLGNELSPLKATVIGVLHPSRFKCPQGLREFARL